MFIWKRKYVSRNFYSNSYRRNLRAINIHKDRYGNTLLYYLCRSENIDERSLRLLLSYIIRYLRTLRPKNSKSLTKRLSSKTI